MSIAAGLPRPRIYVVPDPDPNAFATGRDPEHASIAVTQGLLDTVNRDELQGVVAHELSHVRNLDIRLMTVIAAMVGRRGAALPDWTQPRHAVRRRQRAAVGADDKDGGAAGLILLVVWLVAVVLAPLIGQALAMMVRGDANISPMPRAPS